MLTLDYTMSFREFLCFFLLFFGEACISSMRAFLLHTASSLRTKQATKKPFVASKAGEHRINDAAWPNGVSKLSFEQSRMTEVTHLDRRVPPGIRVGAIEEEPELARRGQNFGLLLPQSRGIDEQRAHFPLDEYYMSNTRFSARRGLSTIRLATLSDRTLDTPHISWHASPS
jgi:hypothetical protein